MGHYNLHGTRLLISPIERALTIAGGQAGHEARKVMACLSFQEGNACNDPSRETRVRYP